MGASLSARFEWADPSQQGAKKLQTSVLNQELLHEILSIIDEICVNSVNESKAEFRRPLVWTCSLSSSSFSSSSIASQFKIQSSSK